MKFLLALVAVLFTLLFIGGPDIETDRLIKEIWGTGHFFLFALIIFSTLQLKTFKSLHWITLFLSTGILCFGFGLATEIVQLLVGRNFQWVDIFNDVVGGYAGLLITYFLKLITLSTPKNSLSYNTRVKLTSCTLGIILLTLIGVRSFIFTLLDQQNMKNTFPILSDFETRFEIKRWDTNSAKLFRSKSKHRGGLHSMKVHFFPDKYPDITLDYFPTDWSDYKRIKFSLLNTEEETIKMIVKIYDQQHTTSNYVYSDRFNQGIFLKPGWNDFSFSLNDIKNTPKNRQMDLTSVQSFSLFMMNLDKEITVYLDDVYLSSN